jgi:putative ABC transport system permease protein
VGSWLVSVLTGMQTIVPASAVLWSLFITSATGLIFGIYPAVNASRLDPVEAMRHE